MKVTTLKEYLKDRLGIDSEGDHNYERIIKSKEVFPKNSRMHSKLTEALENVSLGLGQRFIGMYAGHNQTGDAIPVVRFGGEDYNLRNILDEKVYVGEKYFKFKKPSQGAEVIPLFRNAQELEKTC